jgi:hypothetical protein
VRQIKSYIEEDFCEVECGWNLQGFISSGGSVNSGMRASSCATRQLISKMYCRELAC